MRGQLDILERARDPVLGLGQRRNEHLLHDDVDDDPGREHRLDIERLHDVAVVVESFVVDSLFDEPVVVLNTADGPCVVGGKCTHYGGPLGNGLCADGQIRCPWHHAAFDLSTGEAVGGPALDPIRVYDTVVRGGRVFASGIREVIDTRSPTSLPDSVVIVGAGASGEAAAEALRRYGYAGPIALIGEEPPIDRPNVSKDYLAGTAPEEWMPLRSGDFYSKLGIDLIVGKSVISIDSNERIVRFGEGAPLAYDALLLATGADPKQLPVPGSDAGNVHYLRTLDDSKVIIAALGAARAAVVIGAGFIGLEVAASLRHRNVDVTVVAPEQVPLATLVGERMGRFVTDLHREHGVRFRLGTGVERISSSAVDL